MNTYFSINSQTVHLWRLSLDKLVHFEEDCFILLNDHEKGRAIRFHFPLHKQRFILSHGFCRKILSLYTGITASNMSFEYGPHGKPKLPSPWEYLQFNLSHSDSMAVLAISIQNEIGVDIEKQEPEFKEQIAKRYFSEVEYNQLMTLRDDERIEAFYKIWSRKEALIKALGAGLQFPLQSFFVGFKENKIKCHVNYDNKDILIHVESFHMQDHFQSAFAVAGSVNHIEYWEWNDKRDQPEMLKL